MSTSVSEQLDRIRAGAVEILPEEELKAKLKDSLEHRRPLRIKYGADPSRPDLHLGHFVCLKKLKDFQELGHQVIFIVGDFTAMIGDPSGQSKTRPQLSRKEVEQNSRTYFDQVFKVLDPEKTQVTYNSEWLSKLTAEETIRLSSCYTVARMLERDDFEKRFKDEIPISVHEFLYPIFQGYDSVVIKSDVEIGGTDQKFNFVVAREIQRAYDMAPQAILTMPLLEGTDGKLKMSKSYDNYVGISEPPREIFGKIMSIPDDLVLRYCDVVLRVSRTEREEISKGMQESPRETKAHLAGQIVSLFHTADAASEASREFDRIFKHGEAPDEMPEFRLPKNGKGLVEILVESDTASSKSEARRLIDQGAVRIEGEKVEENRTIQVESPCVLKVGKRRFVKLVPEP
jgi:tyrosyl-tRNA synthetase